MFATQRSHESLLLTSDQHNLCHVASGNASQENAKRHVLLLRKKSKWILRDELQILFQMGKTRHMAIPLDSKKVLFIPARRELKQIQSVIYNRGQDRVEVSSTHKNGANEINSCTHHPSSTIINSNMSSSLPTQVPLSLSSPTALEQIAGLIEFYL